MRNLFKDIELIETTGKEIFQEPVFQFRRLEKKFLLNASTAEMLKTQTSFYIPKDEKASKSPFISSIYYDNNFGKCYFEQVNKTNPRFKIRFRQYGKEKKFSGNGFLEIKKKIDSTSIKDRFKTNLRYLESDWAYTVSPEISELNKKLGIEKLNEIYYTISGSVVQYELEPVVKVTYLRDAFESEDKTLRVTFDSELEFEYIPNKFASPLKYFHKMPDEIGVMEIKYASKIPNWLSSSLKFNRLVQRRFSKFVNAIDNLYGIGDDLQRRKITPFETARGL